MDWLVRTYQTWHWLVVRGSFSQDPNVLFLQVERKFAHEEFILFFHWKFCVWLLKVHPFFSFLLDSETLGEEFAHAQKLVDYTNIQL
jgi:hypothetical protein